jgi:hypothetical protein
MPVIRSRIKLLLQALSLSVIWSIAPTRLIAQSVNSDAAANRALTAQVARMRDLALALELARYGRSHNEALPLIVATSIVLDGGWSPLAAESDDGENPLEPRTLLADAKRFGSGNDAVARLLEPLQERASFTPRGAAGGVKLASKTLAPLGKHRFEIVFLGGQSAAIFVAGDRNSAMQCTVFDAEGNQVASDSNQDAECLITWLPTRRAKFVIEVRNAQEAKRSFLFMTN